MLDALGQEEFKEQFSLCLLRYFLLYGKQYVKYTLTLCYVYH